LAFFAKDQSVISPMAMFAGFLDEADDVVNEFIRNDAGAAVEFDHVVVKTLAHRGAFDVPRAF
jgi:hypothetical protein